MSAPQPSCDLYSAQGSSAGKFLDEALQERFGRDFRHYEHSLRIVEVLERDGTGLNLTADVRDGILCHSGRSPTPRTLEGRIVRLVDRVAYINHDIDDAIRAGVLDPRDLPAAPIAVLGSTGSVRIDRLVHDGRVTDFVSVGVGGLRTGIFNFADVAVVGGMLLLLVATHAAEREREIRPADS